MPLIEFDETTLAGHATTLGTIADFLRAGAGVVAPPNITVAATQANWSEETDGSALFNITLSHAANGPVTVRGRTVAGTAAQGYDFVGVDETFTIPAGQIQVQVAIGIINDAAVESDEAFSFIISDAVGGVITQDTAEVTIQSGDVGDPSPPPPPATGDVARIGGTTYSTLALAIAAAQSGGLIEILPGSHMSVAKVAAFINKPLTLRGVLGAGGSRPVLDLGGDTVSKGILNVGAGPFVCEGVIFANSKATNGNPNVFGTMNASGIRPEPAVLSMTVRNCGFRTCENSVLVGVATSSEFYFEDCDMYQCGYQTSTGQSHGIYIGKIKKVSLVDCVFTQGRGGSDIKSRALETVLDGCTVEQNNITSSAVDLSNGGVLRISGGRYFKPSNSPNDKLIRIAPEGTDGRPESYLIENATLDSQRGSSFLVYNYSSTQCVVRNCTMPSRTTMFGNVRIE